MPELNQNEPKSEVDKKIAREIEIAKLRKASAEALAEEVNTDNLITSSKKALWNGPEVKALDGKITATGNFIETQILANKSLSRLVENLIRDILKIDIFNIDELNFIIYNPDDFPKIEFYLATIDQLLDLHVTLNRTIEKAKRNLKSANLNLTGGATPIAIGAAVGGILRTTADIFSLFKTTATITNYEITSEDMVVVSSFTSKLKEKRKKWKVYDPKSYPVNLLEIQNTQTSQFVKQYNSVNIIVDSALKLIKQIEDELIKIDSELLQVDQKTKTQLERRKLNLNSSLSELQGAIGVFLQLEKNLLDTDQLTKQSTKSLLLRAEKLATLVENRNTFIIKLTAKLNGSTRIKEGLFQMTQAMHSGGAQLYCLIYSTDGSILFADNKFDYHPYRKSSDIK